MISVAFLLLCGLGCFISDTHGIYHYGVEDAPDVANPGEVDIVVIFHEHPKRSGSSSEDSSESSSASSSFESDSSDSSDSSSISARSHSHFDFRHSKFTRSIYSSGGSSDSDFSSSISDSLSTESGSGVFPPRHSAGHSSGSGYSRFSTGTSSPNRSVRPPVSRTNGRRLGAGSFGSTTERDSDDESNDESDDESDDELIIRFTAFGELIKVKLRQTRSTIADSTTPVYYTESSKSASEVRVTKLPENALARAIKIYQDEKTESSLLVGRDEYGDTYFLGIVAGYNIRRHPLRSGRRNPQRSSINELKGSDYHIVSRISRKR